MCPPEPPKRPRQPSRPDVFVGVEQPEKYAVRHHPGVDGSPQALPKRSATLTGLPAPAAPGATLPRSPPLPAELSPTAPAPPRSPLRETIRRPTPPSAVAAARRTDPPAASELPPTSIRVPAEPTSPSSPPGVSLPPPSASPEQARIVAKDREIERLRNALAQERRDARAAAETRVASYPPPTTPRPIEHHAPVAPLPAPPETFRGVTLTQAKIGLLMAITAILFPLAPFVAWKVSTIQSGSKRTEDQVAATAKVAEAAKTTAAGSDEAAKVARAQRQADMLYLIAILKKQGVQVRKPDGWPDLPEIETEAPVRRPGRIDPGPVLIVKTAPSP